MNKTSKRIFSLAIFAVLTALIVIAVPKITTKTQDYFNRQKIDRLNEETIESVSDTESIVTENNISTELLPESAYLEVPFICQAPLQTEENWTLHEESCEEAATLQAYLYETGRTMTKPQANTEILNMIDWQKSPKNFGAHHDLYANDMKKFITGYYNLEDEEVKIIYDAEIEDIKKQIAADHPVIVPITGDILNNPYYPYPGYHMLTVIGYTKDRIITNDNGTRRGADFSYDTKIFTAAMKDAGGDILIFNLTN